MLVQVAVFVQNNKHLTQQYVGALNNFVKHELWANRVCASECCGLIDRKLCEAAKLKPQDRNRTLRYQVKREPEPETHKTR